MSEIKTLGQLLNHLANKAGVAGDDQNLMNILSNAELTKVPVNPELIKAIDENLMSVASAKDNHPLIKNHYHGQALNAVDKIMDNIIEKAGLDDDIIQELSAEKKNTYKCLTLLGEKLIAKQKQSTKPEDKSALQAQVEDLAAKLRQAEAEKAGAVESVEKLRKKDRIDFNVHLQTLPKKTIYDELSPSVKATSINTILANALQNDGVEFTFDDAGNFIMQKTDGTTYMGANHEKITPEAYIDKVLAQNKLLVVAPEQDDKPDPQTPPPPRTVNGGKGTPNGNNQTANLNRRNRIAAEKNAAN